MSHILKVRKKDGQCKFCMRETLCDTCLYQMWHIPKQAAGSASSQPQIPAHGPRENHSHRTWSTASSSDGLWLLSSVPDVGLTSYGGDFCCCNRTSGSGGIFWLL